MESSRSPRKVMVLAWKLAGEHLPMYAHKFSRRDRCTEPQLFACLVLRQFYNLSYRRTQALLEDCPDLRAAVGIKAAPDHNTLCDAFGRLAKLDVFAPMLDTLVAAFAAEGLLGLDRKPAAADSSCYESRHVSRHYERRRRQTATGEAKKSERSATIKKLPKLSILIACSCHLVLSFVASTGMGSDRPHLGTLACHAWRRADLKTLVADAGYDAEASHELLRDGLGVESLIPATIGRPSDKPPATFYRRLMRRCFDDPRVKSLYGQRWQAETVNGMMKRNYGSALRAATPERRERELMLKVLTHNLAL